MTAERLARYHAYTRKHSVNWPLYLLARTFLLPFFLLLVPRIRRSRGGVVAIAALLVAMAVLRGWWIVLPAMPRGIGWVDLACLLGIGGTAAAIALRAGNRLRLHNEVRHHA